MNDPEKALRRIRLLIAQRNNVTQAQNRALAETAKVAGDTAKVITAWTPLLDSLAARVADLENDRAATYRLLDEAFSLLQSANQRIGKLERKLRE